MSGLPGSRPEGNEGTQKQVNRLLYEVGSLWQRVRKKVDRAGDTMTGTLTIDGSQERRVSTPWANGAAFIDASGDGQSNRAYLQFQIENSDGTFASEIVLYASDDANWSNGTKVFRGTLARFNENVEVNGDFTVDGAKNVQITDPDDPSIAYRFAATESDRLGVLEHEVELETGQTYSLPEHWPRIATNLRCYLQPLGEGHVWPEVDTENWTVTPRGQPGRVLALIRADRADIGVTNWTHEVEVSEDEGAS